MRIMPYMVMPTCKLEDCAHCSAQYKTPACNPLVVHSCFAYRLIHVLIQNISDLFNQFGLGLREEPLKRSLFDRVTLTGDIWWRCGVASKASGDRGHQHQEDGDAKLHFHVSCGNIRLETVSGRDCQPRNATGRTAKVPRASVPIGRFERAFKARMNSIESHA